MLLRLVVAGLVAISLSQPVRGQEEAAPTVSLHEAGAEPRHRIRYQPEEGSVETMVMTMLMDVRMTVDGRPVPSGRTPSMRMTMTIDIRDVEEDGDIRYAMRLEQADVLEAEGVPAELAARLRDSLKSMVGLSGDVLVSDRGITKQAEFRLPDGAGPEMEQMLAGMRQSLSQFSAPTPEEPVGVGAKWTVRMSPAANGLRLDQTMSYTLESIDEAGAAMSVDYTQGAKPQQVMPVGLPPGTTIELKSLAGSGAGRMKIIYANLVPTESTIQGSTKSEMAVKAPGVTQQVSQEIRLDVKVGPKAQTPGSQ